MPLYLGISLEYDLLTKHAAMSQVLENMRTKGEQASSTSFADEP